MTENTIVPEGAESMPPAPFGPESAGPRHHGASPQKPPQSQKPQPPQKLQPQRSAPPDRIPSRRVGPAPLVNAANLLTAVRIVLVPVFVALTVASGMSNPSLRIAACITFFVASVTDFADGWIARTWDMVTSFGKVADPIADKALTGSAFVLLSAYGVLPWWVTIVILGREIGVTALRFWVIRRGVIAASRGGKIKTALQTLAIVWYLVPFGPDLAAVGKWIMAVALLVTVVTGIDYVARALRLRRAVPAAPGR